eukprot:14368813-Ditylum_brightwellii.AAC.1
MGIATGAADNKRQDNDFMQSAKYKALKGANLLQKSAAQYEETLTSKVAVGFGAGGGQEGTG